MTETLANGYSPESTQRELSNEYQHDRVQKLCFLVLWKKVASALEGLTKAFYGKIFESLLTTLHIFFSLVFAILCTFPLHLVPH